MFSLTLRIAQSAWVDLERASLGSTTPAVIGRLLIINLDLMTCGSVAPSWPMATSDA